MSLTRSIHPGLIFKYSFVLKYCALFFFYFEFKGSKLQLPSSPWEKQRMIPVQESHFTLHLNCLSVFIFYGPAVLSSVTLTALNYVEAQACDTSEPARKYKIFLLLSPWLKIKFQKLYTNTITSLMNGIKERQGQSRQFHYLPVLKD